MMGRRLSSCFVCAAVIAVGHDARAEAPAAPPPSETETVPKLVRLGLSKRASEKLSELRVARLVELQLGGDVSVASEALGPLDEQAFRVFIDMSEPTRVDVQLQIVGKRVETRSVDVSGLPWEVATRFVAIATSEALRSLMAPPRKPRLRPPSPDEIADKLAAEPSYEIGGAVEAAYVGDASTAVLGSRLALAFHQRPLSERISIAFLGSLDGSLWIEGDFAAAHRFWFGPDLRLKVGGGFALAGTGTPSDDLDVWLRAHALLELDVRVTPSSFFVIGLDPGITIDPVAMRASGATDESVGPWIGGSVAFTFEGK